LTVKSMHHHAPEIYPSLPLSQEWYLELFATFARDVRSSAPSVYKESHHSKHQPRIWSGRGPSLYSLGDLLHNVRHTSIADSTIEISYLTGYHPDADAWLALQLVGIWSLTGLVSWAPIKDIRPLERRIDKALKADEAATRGIAGVIEVAERHSKQR